VTSLRAEPFRIAVAEADLVDLRLRLRRSRLPTGPDDPGWQYGVARDYLAGLLAEWAEDYDWREHERRMNDYAHLRIDVQGQSIHVLHVERPGVLPLLLLGGWPQTFWDFRDLIPALPDYELVVPDLPGQGFSVPLRRTGIGYVQAAEMMHEVMIGLGHSRYGVYGTDWGALMAEYLAVAHPDAIVGLHTTMPVPLDFSPSNRERATEWAADEQERRAAAAAQAATGSGYLLMHVHSPQTVAYLADSPAASAAWLIDKVHAWTDHDGDLESAYPRDQLLTLLSIFWFTNSIGSAARLYAESFRTPWTPPTGRSPLIAVPTAVAAYPRESGAYPRSWVEQYVDLRRWTARPRGGHFPAVEDAAGLAADIAAFFSELAPAPANKMRRSHAVVR